MFLLKKWSCQILIELLRNMNQSFANETQIYNLIVFNLLINYLNLIKESMQKQLFTAVL